MPEYTLLAVVSVVAVVVLERLTRVGLFGQAQYWIAVAVVFAFQVPVDGWLTKLSAPIVVYNPQHHLGLRFPWDIPVEDYLFGFSMVTLALIVWRRATAPRPGTDSYAAQDVSSSSGHPAPDRPLSDDPARRRHP